MRRIYQERKEKGEYHLLIRDMKMFDQEYFFSHFRMTPQKFEELLSLVGHAIAKDAAKREPIGPQERLCVTLRYLVTGDAQATIAASYRISKTSISRIILETCRAIWKILLHNGFLDYPNTAEQWRKIADAFERPWNFPNCLGCIDGKHVVMQSPARSGSYFYNYKGTHSIVLMAVVNPFYEFTFVDIGDAGRQSDGGVFAASDLGFALEHSKLCLPKSRCPERYDKALPFVFVGDEAFPLKEYLIKPYPRTSLNTMQRITNYRISRARNLVENVFGICASRFRVFRRPIIARVEVVEAVTKAIVALHNFLMHGRKVGHNSPYCPTGYAEGDWRKEGTANDGLQPMRTAGSNNYTRDAKVIRDDFKEYFNSEVGQVPWQMDMIRRTSNPFDS